ncbi:MAG: molybdenum cofactor guanylyltransferase [Pseudomonadota bacterium]
MPQPAIALLLAGGASARMGRDKATLEFRDRPLWQHMAQTLQEAGCRDVMISGDPDRIPAAFPDSVPGLGPLAGLATALARTGDGHRLLVVPVDLPLFDAVTARLLLAAPPAGAVSFHGHALPALLRVDVTLRTALAALLADPDPRMHAVHRLLARLETREIALPVTHEAALTNTNSPEEWQRALARAGPP